jgi:hypothetical protein
VDHEHELRVAIADGGAQVRHAAVVARDLLLLGKLGGRLLGLGLGGARRRALRGA